MIVYISGPMTGYIDFNRDAFHAAEAHLASKGFHVVNVARLDEGQDTEDWSHADYMKRDLALLLDCDLIYMLPGWSHSKGASIENTVAKAVGILELHDPDVETWRTFEGEPEVETSAEWLGEGPFAGLTVAVDPTLPPESFRLDGPHDSVTVNLADYKAECAGAAPAGDGDLSAEPDVDGESHYLAGVERFAEGDEFPNVGYVRRMRAVAEHREPSPIERDSGAVLFVIGGRA